MKIRRSVLAVCLVSLLAMMGVSSSVAANNSQQTGLVNVSLGDVDLLNNVNLAVAANVAATVCGVTVPVAVLAQQVVAQGGDTICETDAGPLTVEQTLNSPPSSPGAGGNNSQQDGLVNVSLGDIAILNDVNAAVAANVAVTACNLAIPVAVLAAQIVASGGDFTCDTVSGPITVDQA